MIMKLKHVIDLHYPEQYEQTADGFQCYPCNWFTSDSKQSWPIIAQEMLDHLDEVVPEYRIDDGIATCNYCGMSTGNAGLSKTIIEVIEEHIRDDHEQVP